MFGEDLNLDDVNPASVEAAAEAGGLIPAGKYHARLEGAATRTAKSGRGGVELEFQLLAGPFAGREVKDTLWDSDTDAGKNRIILFGHRLGALTVDPKTKKYVRVEGKAGLEDCLGAEVVIEVTHEPDKDNPAKKWTRVGYAIWDVSDSKVKDVLKAKTKPGGTAAAATKPAPKPKVDTSTL